LRKLLLFLILALLCFTASVGLAYEPYYKYIHTKNPKLKPHEIETIISANRKYSTKYGVDIFWHLCKTGHESSFKPSIGSTFVVGGHKYNNEPCYGIEAIQVEVVKDMYPSLSEKQIRHKLLNDLAFAIEVSYRLDYANKLHAKKMNYSTDYQRRAVGIILYNSGVGSWRRYHTGLAKWLRTGKKLEDIRVSDWSELRLNFREVYSLNYYSSILTQAAILRKIVANSSVPEAK